MNIRIMQIHAFFNQRKEAEEKQNSFDGNSPPFSQQ